MTDNEIAKHAMDATFLILLKPGSKRVVNGLEEPLKKISWRRCGVA